MDKLVSSDLFSENRDYGSPVSNRIITKNVPGNVRLGSDIKVEVKVDKGYVLDSKLVF